MTTTLTITSGQTSFTAQGYTILPSPGTAVPDNLAQAILSAAVTAGVVLSSSAGTGVITVPARRFTRSGVGPPVSGEGFWLLGDEIVDSAGTEYECSAPGNPGTWTTAQSGTFEPKAAALLGRRKSLPKPVEVDAVMATPPTISAPATSSGLPSIQGFAAANNGIAYDRFTYRGCANPVVAGVSAPSNGFIGFPYITDPTAGGYGRWIADFICDDIQFELYMKGLTNYRVRVDGQLTSTAVTTIPADGQVYYHRHLFASRAPRRITVEGSGQGWGGVLVTNTGAVWKAHTVRGPKVVVVGDSFAEGTGSTGGSNGPLSFGQTMVEALGWQDACLSGLGGTGYLNPGTGGRVKFRDRATNDWQSLAPDVIVYAGGINDQGSYTASAIQTEVAALLAADKAALPSVIQIVVSPFWRGGVSTFTSTLIPTRDAIKAAATAAGAYFLDVLELPLDGAALSGTITNSPASSGTSLTSTTKFVVGGTVEIGTGTANVERRVITASSGGGPYTYTVAGLTNAHTAGDVLKQVGNCFWTGTGKVGATASNGNSDVYVGADGTHPTDAGHQALGRVLAGLVARTVLAP